MKSRKFSTRTVSFSLLSAGIAALVCLAATPGCYAQTVTATVAAGANPQAVAVNPVTNKIYVANQGSNNVTVIDGATNNTTTVPAGTEPLAVAVNPVTNKIYVANLGDNTVTVIDGATNNTTTVPVGTEPIAVAVNPVTNKIYVASYVFSHSVTVIDGATNNTTTVAAGLQLYAVAVNPVTNKIYVANYGGDNVTVIDGATNNTAAVSTGSGSGPIAIAVSPVTNKIYVANYYSHSVTVIDGATNKAVTVSAGSLPYAVAVNPVTNKIYVANYGGHNVTVIDGSVSQIPTYLQGSCGNAGFPYGGNYMCNLNVGSTAGAATGAITYTFDSNAPVTVPLNSGMAQFSLIAPHVGSHTVAIIYAQQGKFAAADPRVENFTVAQATTSVQLTPSNYYPGAGSILTLSVSVTSYSAAPPTSGPVAFFDNGTAVVTTFLNAQGQTSFTIPALPAGYHSFHAQFGGLTPDYAGASSNYLTIQAH